MSHDTKDTLKALAWCLILAIIILLALYLGGAFETYQPSWLLDGPTS